MSRRRVIADRRPVRLPSPAREGAGSLSLAETTGIVREALEPLGYVPPAEFEKAYHDRQAAPVGMAVLT
jgi:hypothetical protein